MRFPVYEQQVRLQGRNRTDLSVRANPNAFGAQIGAAVQDLGVGIGKVAEAFRFKEALVADGDARAATNTYIDYSRDVLYDPQTGALNQTGAKGMAENRDAANERLAEKRKQIEANLGPQAKKIFTDAADQLDNTAKNNLIKHDSEQTKNYVNTQAESTVEGFLQVAVDNYGSEEEWNKYVNAAIAEAEGLGRLNGMPPETILLKKAEILKGAHSNRAIRIAYDDPIKADAYVDSHREELGEAEYTRLKTGMEAAVVDSKADAEIEKLRGSDAYVGKRGGGEDTWLRYSNTRKIRDKPISPKMKMSLGFLRDMGITMEVFSGGQDAAGPGAQRTGSTRHDHGDAADVFFYKDGRKLDWNNPADIPYFNEIVARAKANGVTGFGAGDGYMSDGSMHIGFGNPGVWGAGGAGSKAAPWLVAAYAGAALGDTPASLVDEGMGTRSAYEAVMRIEDPKVRAAAMAKLDAQLKTEASLNIEDQKTAANEAWTLYTQQGMRPQDVPMDLQIRMGREATLNFFESAKAYDSGTLATDELRYSELQRMSVEDPQGFAELDLSYDRTNFSKGDYRAIEQMQLEIIQGISTADQKAQGVLDDPATMAKVYTDAEQVYNDAVPSAGPKRSQQEAAAYNRFQESVKRYARDFMLEKRRPMTFDEQDKLFSMLLTPIVLEESGTFGSSRDAMLFDAPLREAGERVRGNLSAADVTLADEKEAREELLKFYGREPSDDEILAHHNNKVLAKLGISPEMEYSEVPRDVRRSMEERYPDASDEELVDMYIDFVLAAAKHQ